MAKVSRVLDAVVIGDELVAPGTEAVGYGVGVFGDITSCTLTLEEEEKIIPGLRGGTTQGHLPSKIVDLKVTPTGTITFIPNDLQFLKYVISDFTSDATTYTLDNRSTANPQSISIKGNYDNSNGLKGLGFYLTNVRFAFADEDILTVTADLKGLFGTIINEVVEYIAPTKNPLTFADVTFTVATNEWDLQSLNITYDPKLIQKWGMNTKTAGQKRFPSEILRGAKSMISLDGVANAQDVANELQIVYGGLSPQDSKSELDIVLTLVDTSDLTHTINITGKIGKADVSQNDSEENSKTIAFSGVGKDFQADGEKE